MVMGGYQTYRQTDVITADPKKLVIMCYEEAIRNLNLAARMYSSGNYEVKGKSVQKALDIISELREALDFDRGGSIATSLETLYTFMTTHIIKSDQARNEKGLQQVASMLEQLKSAWERVFFGSQEEPVLPAGNTSPTFKPSEGARTAQSAGYLR
ncbi:MAG: flagellar export chaperone FliS [Deltaproteobacteria bacterium]